MHDQKNIKIYGHLVSNTNVSVRHNTALIPNTTKCKSSPPSNTSDPLSFMFINISCGIATMGLLSHCRNKLEEKKPLLQNETLNIKV